MWATGAAGNSWVMGHRVVIYKATRYWSISHVLWVVHTLGPYLRRDIFSGRVICHVRYRSFISLVRNPALSIWMRNLGMPSSRIYRVTHYLVILLLKVPLVLTLVHRTASWGMGNHELLLLHFLILLELLKLLELKKLLVLIIRHEWILLPVVRHDRVTLNFDSWLLLLLKLSLSLSKLLCLG